MAEDPFTPTPLSDLARDHQAAGTLDLRLFVASAQYREGLAAAREDQVDEELLRFAAELGLPSPYALPRNTAPAAVAGEGQTDAQLRALPG